MTTFLPISCQTHSDMDEEENLDMLSFDDVIDQVARANFAKDSNILPEIQTSRCLIHGRQDKRHDLIYSSNHHGGKVLRAHNKYLLSGDDFKVGDNVHTLSPPADLACEIPFYKRRRLPEELPSKMFVASWLIHGSQPASENHFPEIVTSDKKFQHAKHTCGRIPVTQMNK